jgi:hypothetical protein
MAQSVLAMWAEIALRCVELWLEVLVARWSGPQVETQAAGSQCQGKHPLLPAAYRLDGGLNQPVR